MRYSI